MLLAAGRPERVGHLPQGLTQQTADQADRKTEMRRAAHRASRKYQDIVRDRERMRPSEIPKGLVVAAKNLRSKTCRPSALRAITQAQLLQVSVTHNTSFTVQ